MVPTRFLYWAGAAALIAAGALSLYRGWADTRVRPNTLAAAVEAVRLDPGNASARLWLAEHQEREGQDPSEAFGEAIRLRPADSAGWIRRGLYRESVGRMEEAEADLVHAAGIDELWEPRWSLVNFYYRRGREAEFWDWVRNAISVTGPETARDLQPLWNLCWSWPDGAEKMGSFWETKPILAESYLDFLRRAEPSERTTDAAGSLLVKYSMRVKSPALLLWSTRLIEGGQVEAAKAAWARLVEVGEVVEADEGFEKAPAGEGFGWRVMTPYTHLRPGLALRFDGKQAERMEVMWRYAAGAYGEGAAVAVDWDAPAGSGFAWRVEAVGEGVWRVVLGYGRPLGSARFQGVVRVRGARVAGR